MNSGDNSNLLAYDKNFEHAGFTAVVNFTYNAGAKTVTFTDAGAYPAGNGLKRIQVQVADEYGNTVKGHIDAAAGNSGALDIATLNPSKGLNLTATVVTSKGWTANGGAYRTNLAAGSLATWNYGESAAEAVN